MAYESDWSHLNNSKIQKSLSHRLSNHSSETSAGDAVMTASVGDAVLIVNQYNRKLYYRSVLTVAMTPFSGCRTYLSLF